MDKTRWSSFFSIPHYFSYKTSALNLEKYSCRDSKLFGLREISWFSIWCPLISSIFPKRSAIFSHTSFSDVNSIKMEKEVSGNTQTQEAISLIPPIVPFYLLCSCIGLCFYFHSHPIDAFFSKQYLHLCFPFKEIERSQDSFLWLIHSSRKSVPAVSRRLPVTDVEPANFFLKEINNIQWL